MKKLTIEISDIAHLELLKIQLERKMGASKRTTIVHIASDVLNDHLEEKAKKK